MRSASSGESSIATCDSGGSDWAKSMTAGMRRATSVESCSGPLGIGSPSPPPASATACRAIATSSGWNGVGAAPNTRRELTVQSNAAAASSQALRQSVSIAASDVGVEVRACRASSRRSPRRP